MSTRDKAAAAGLVALFAALCVAVAFLPALTIDETRYLTVAWEMRATGHWSLPTLNFEPYSHKPPLLFWLINASWSVFGLGVWPARVIGALATIAVLVLTHSLDKRLTPNAPPGPAPSALMLLALPLFVAFGFSIMFDMLLTATVTGAMLALWIAGRTGHRVAFAGYAVCIGLALLAKGPVALLFVLPPAFLAPYWIEPENKRSWAFHIGLSLAFGFAMVLAWALRAAYLGGPEFAEMLFWKQSAGRIASSFAHARPVWFYLPILLMLLLPLLLWRPVVSGLLSIPNEARPARNFLLSWSVPAFVGLSLVSGKQIHYLFPLLPAAALLISLGLRNSEPRRSDKLPLLILAGLVLSVLTVLAVGGNRWLPDDGTVTTIVSKISLPLLLLTGALVLGAIASMGGAIRRSLTGLAIANLIVLTSIAVQSRDMLADLFDLQPLADVIAPLRNRPIATTQETRGEFGFLARLERPLVYVPRKQLNCWMLNHPDGVAIVRAQSGAKLADLDPELVRVLAVKRYRVLETITVFEVRGENSQATADQNGIASSCGNPG